MSITEEKLYELLVLDRISSGDDVSNLKEATIKNLNVYKQNYIYGHIDALKNRYPCTVIALGENNFNYFAKNFLDHFPPSKPNMDEYGEEFCDFLKSKEELSSQPVIGELANIDNHWFNGIKESQTPSYEGVLGLWNAILNDEEAPEFDFEQGVTLTLKSINGDLYFLESKENGKDK